MKIMVLWDVMPRRAFIKFVKLHGVTSEKRVAFIAIQSLMILFFNESDISNVFSISVAFVVLKKLHKFRDRVRVATRRLLCNIYHS
jgi:hypothetical protein